MGELPETLAVVNPKEVVAQVSFFKLYRTVGTLPPELTQFLLQLSC